MDRVPPRRPLLEACRPRHAAKSLLVFVPLLAAHGPFVGATLGPAVATFVAFVLVASAIYLVNDVLDAEADRSHPVKRGRAIASGRVSSRRALRAAGALLGLAAGALLVARVPSAVALVLALYVGLALLYTFVLKRLLLLDVFVLSALTMARLLAGGAATTTPISPWLMAFSGFLFLDLAFLKRYGELRVREPGLDERVPGRAYRGRDLPILLAAGVACGTVAVLVLALYVNGSQATALYARPAWLWLACPALLYWITRMWILVHRGGREDDPLVLALRDPASYAAGLWILAVAVAATG